MIIANPNQLTEDRGLISFLFHLMIDIMALFIPWWHKPVHLYRLIKYQLVLLRLVVYQPEIIARALIQFWEDEFVAVASSNSDKQQTKWIYFKASTSLVLSLLFSFIVFLLASTPVLCVFVSIQLWFNIFSQKTIIFAPLNHYPHPHLPPHPHHTNTLSNTTINNTNENILGKETLYDGDAIGFILYTPQFERVLFLLTLPFKTLFAIIQRFVDTFQYYYKHTTTSHYVRRNSLHKKQKKIS